MQGSCGMTGSCHRGNSGRDLMAKGFSEDRRCYGGRSHCGPSPAAEERASRQWASFRERWI